MKGVLEFQRVLGRSNKKREEALVSVHGAEKALQSPLNCWRGGGSGRRDWKFDAAPWRDGQKKKNPLSNFSAQIGLHGEAGGGPGQRKSAPRRRDREVFE